MGVNLSGQLLGLWALNALLLVTAVLSLLFSLGLTSRVLRQRYLVEVPKGGVFKEANGVNSYHPASHKPKLPGLKDNGASKVFSILEAPVVVGLLLGLLPTLVVSKLFVLGREVTGSLDELNLSLTKLALSLIGSLLDQL